MTNGDTAADLNSLIIRTPGVLGGAPCLRNHRVGIHRVAHWWQLGLTVEEIAEEHSSLSMAEIHAALAYYHLHPKEIKGYLEAERQAAAGASGLPASA